MKNKSRGEETEKKSSELIVYIKGDLFMSKLNKLAGRFIYKGCWEKKQWSNKSVLKVKKKKKKTLKQILVWFGFLDCFVGFFCLFSLFSYLDPSDYYTWPKKNDYQSILLSFVKS